MIFEMLRWWYVTGWVQAAHRIMGWTSAVERMFSLSLLAQTLFSPWRRIVSMAGRGLDAKLHASMDNLISRCVGFFIRLFVIIAALLTMLGALISSAFIALLWPFMPLLVIALIIKGITG